MKEDEKEEELDGWIDRSHGSELRSATKKDSRSRFG